MYNIQYNHNDAHILKRPPYTLMGPDPSLSIAYPWWGAERGRVRCSRAPFPRPPQPPRTPYPPSTPNPPPPPQQ